MRNAARRPATAPRPPRRCTSPACARCSSSCRATAALAGRAFQSSSGTAPTATADAAARRRATGPASGRRSARLRPRRLPAQLAGDDGAGHPRASCCSRARTGSPARCTARSPASSSRGDDRGLHPARGAESRHRRHRHHLLRQPVVPFPHSLMIAYTAEYAARHAAGDDEIADAQWFALDALPVLPARVSIARRLIEATVARLRAQLRSRTSPAPARATIAALARGPSRAIPSPTIRLALPSRCSWRRRCRPRARRGADRPSAVVRPSSRRGGGVRAGPQEARELIARKDYPAARADRRPARAAAARAQARFSRASCRRRAARRSPRSRRFAR